MLFFIYFISKIKGHILWDKVLNMFFTFFKFLNFHFGSSELIAVRGAEVRSPQKDGDREKRSSIRSDFIGFIIII